MRTIRILAVVTVVALASWWLSRPTLESAALLMDMTGAAPGLRGWVPARTFDVATTDLEVPTRFGAIAARLYRPATANSPAVAIFPGVHAGGVDEPRLAKLSRRIAAAGATVLSTPLPDLRAYRVTTRATDMIEDVALWLAGRSDLAPSGRVGIVGVSFAGGLALVASGRPSLKDRLTAVFTLGAHADLPRVIQYLCSAEGAPKTLAPPHDYGVVLMLRASIGIVAPTDQRPALDHAIVTFLDASSAETTDRTLSAQLFERARAEEAALPEPSLSLMHAVNERDTASLGRLLAPHAEEIGGAPALSPARSHVTRAPVYLLHGVDDNVIPSSESVALGELLERSGNADVHLLLTPLVSHATARPDSTAGDIWRLVRFWTRMWDAFEEER
jgi:dienelactone hydrolase